MMQIGTLRHQLTIQALARTYASTGSTDVWAAISDTRSDDGVVWGRVERLQGTEAIRAHQVDSRTTHRVTMRYNATITPKHRLLFGSRVFHPTSIIDVDERNAVLVVDAWEEVV